jgi:galactose mutarotase-like enzyme
MDNRYTLGNGRLQIVVRQTGAELCEIKSLTDGREYMWNASPSVWAGYSPVLFPVIGALKEDSYLFQGRKYHLPRHGFMRNNAKVRLVSSSHNSLLFQLDSDPDTLRVYPFRFVFRIRYVLQDNCITVGHEIINPDDEAMYFSLGGHPAFRCPLDIHEKYSDYYLEFEYSESACTWQIEKDGLIGKKGRMILDNSRTIDLHYDLFSQGALVFKDLRSRKVSLISKISGKRVQVDYEGFPYMGIWAKPHADFVCIEPWIGIADPADTDKKFETKEGIVRLAGKGRFEAGYSIQVF